MNNLKNELQNRYYTEGFISNFLAIIIGIITGLAFVAYDQVTFYFTTLFFNTPDNSLPKYIILLPAAGGLCVGLISHQFMKKSRCGVAEVVEATALQGGKIQSKFAFYEVFLSMISICTGGSVGKEAPGILAGTGVGATVANRLKSPDHRFRILIACGASGGIAAAFHAPLAGVVFVVEVILGELQARTLIPVVLSSVFSTLVTDIIFGIQPIQVSYYGMESPFREPILYIIMGVLAGIVAAIFIKCTYLTQDSFEKLPIKPYLKPALGGLVVGCIGYFYPQIFGIGYDVIKQSLNNELAMQMLLILLVLKIVAFAFTVGSGGSGGAIVPSLFAGSMLGGGFGNLVNYIFPLYTAPAGAYALVGMGAVFAGVVRAPLTAMLILFELTRDYSLILPLMLTCVISNVISTHLHEESIYTELLRRRGHVIRAGTKINLMESLTVRDNMVRDVLVLNVRDTTANLLNLMQKSKHAGFPVLDNQGKLAGIVTLHDMRDKVKQGELEKPVIQIMTEDVATAYPDESLDIVLKRLAAHDVGRLPVVSRNDGISLIGIITRSDIVKSYDREIVNRMQTGEDDNLKPGSL
ncbi:chloride channel protein [Methanohalophilus portucalensis]|uniref:CBS domain-containing protein n=3 Tax=Methanohalophilus portucalensis TaxID=39664 RepID=A0A1X7NKK9_9EURY|nr:chloride channel protein [Methanohalophilus portucalensis]ATU07572.1 Cl- channel voltage-gated family protein [Methanohalophilus portucalensis]RNI10298.1 CBS domain-containing protein [Methanohalophilus portucalensis FDF-1]SMH38011.1 chloride channel protein, CIC family [Methanohalophilus portucalensis FDF-1]